MDSAAVTARAAILDMQPLMTLSRDPLTQPGSHPILSLSGSTAPMARGQWRGGKILIWDATCPDTFPSSYEPLATREAGAVAAEAEQRKRQKYANLDGNHFFVRRSGDTWGDWT